MSVTERLLLVLSRRPETDDYHNSDDDVTVDSALDLLREEFGSDIVTDLAGRRIVDYGSGYGRHAVAYARAGARQVTCVDINADNLARARRLAEASGVADRIATVLGDAHGVTLPAEQFDRVISINAFEHFAHPERILAIAHRALRPRGRFIITFGPPWLHPYGSHMHFFTKVPWPHVFFSERTVMSARRRYRTDGAMRYTEVPGGLNRMTVRRFIRMAGRSGYRMVTLRCRGIKRMDAVSRLPLLREFVTNRISSVLEKP